MREGITEGVAQLGAASSIVHAAASPLAAPAALRSLLVHSSP